MKKMLFFLLILTLATLSACSTDNTVQDQFDTYVAHWNKQDFDKMYDMVTDKSQETYPTKKFVDRYQNIYKDLHVTDLKVTAGTLDDDTLKKANKKGKAVIPYKVKMKTIAGPIDFSGKATLIKEGKKDDAKWLIKWDPGFIFPAIKNGEKLSLSIEHPVRGEILDRNRMPLALNGTVDRVGVVPGKFSDNPTATKKKIASLLNISVKTIDKKLNASWVKPDQFVPLADIPTSEEETIGKLLQLSPILIQKTTGRIYPAGEAAAHLIGYIGKVTADDLKKQKGNSLGENDMIGKRGLEKLYDEKLRGKKGAKITVIDDNDDEQVLAEKQAVDGEDIHTTIDINTQEEIYKAYDGKAGETAAINPKTGETLALVSSPAFDPNKMMNGLSKAEWDKMQKDPKKPLFNRFNKTFVPGSVIKPITAAIGLKNGTLDPNKGITIKGSYWGKKKGWGDFKVHRVSTTNKPVDLADALIRSDNIYFAKQAVHMGAKKFAKGLKQFGFGEKFPFDYPIEKSTFSSNGKFSDEVQVANTGYGQGEMLVNPLFLASAYTTILNNGNMLKPTLLLDEKKGQVWKKDLITKKQATLLQKDLRKVVTEPRGTAKAAKKAGFAISGKTGTAELKKSHDEKNGAENGWFVAYPTDDQDILIAMMMEHVEGIGGSAFNVKKVTHILKEIRTDDD